MKKYFVLPVAVLLGALSLSSCSESDDDDNNTTNTFDIVKTSPVVDEDSYPANTADANYKVNTFGNTAMNACEELGIQLGKANEIIGKAKLSGECCQQCHRTHLHPAGRQHRRPGEDTPRTDHSQHHTGTDRQGLRRFQGCP